MPPTGSSNPQTKMEAPFMTGLSYTFMTKFRHNFRGILHIP